RASKQQVAALMEVFEFQPVPSSQLHEQLAERLGMSKKAVRNCFQNQRAKTRRTSSTSNALKREGSMSAPSSPPVS
ncbi:hypothetical protein BC830DRAFT_1044144, partial [Chytriomyces sp. MP71]